MADSSLLPSEAESLAVYRAFRDAGHFAPTNPRDPPAKPSQALAAAGEFWFATREAAALHDELARLDALHEAGAKLAPSIRAALDRLVERIAPDNPILRHAVSVGELLAEPAEPTRWLVEDLLQASGSSLLVAPPKAGKTTAARCLAVAVARGLPWLGRACEHGPVLYLALEERREEVKLHFEQLGARPDDPITVYVQGAPPDGMGALRAAVRALKPALVIVDPLFRLIRMPDGNDYAPVTLALEPVVTLGRETGAHLMLVHHTRKGGARMGKSPSAVRRSMPRSIRCSRFGGPARNARSRVGNGTARTCRARW